MYSPKAGFVSISGNVVAALATALGRGRGRGLRPGSGLALRLLYLRATNVGIGLPDNSLIDSGRNARGGRFFVRL